MILNPPARVRILSGGQYTMRLRSLHRAYPSLHSFGVVHWVPEQLNIKAVTGACKLIDGCSLALCLATDSVVSAGICHRNKVNSIAWLYRRAQPKDSILLHYITLHNECRIWFPRVWRNGVPEYSWPVKCPVIGGTRVSSAADRCLWRAGTEIESNFLFCRTRGAIQTPVYRAGISWF